MTQQISVTCQYAGEGSPELILQQSFKLYLSRELTGKPMGA